jgi:hypothetical protein
MKKYLFTVLLLCAFSLSFAQPYATVKEGYVAGKQIKEFPSSPNRTTPPGTLIFSSPFTCPPANGLRSETNTTNSEVADDFVLNSNWTVSIARWWFFMGDDPATTSWIIRIYNNQNCLPSSLVTTWNVSAADVNYENVCSAFGFSIYDCWANLTPPFTALSGQHYWISIQAVGWVDYWATSNATFDCMGAFKCAYVGYPDWVPDSTQLAPTDFAFELYGSRVPLSNWALILGVVLIGTFVFIRYRRMI